MLDLTPYCDDSGPHPFCLPDVDKALQRLIGDGYFASADAALAARTGPPSVLVVAGYQGSGKTYLLEKKLLQSERYPGFVRLYQTDFRKLHPGYHEMEDKGVLYVYEHTEKFIWALGSKVFGHVLANAYDFIMETALDSPGFASVPPLLAQQQYRFEVHLVSCLKEFSHWATLDRGIKSLRDNDVERFLHLSQIETMQVNARPILDAFETACANALGSTITLHYRGIETGLESKLLCSSLCDAPGALTPQPHFHDAPYISLPNVNAHFEIRHAPGADTPCSFLQYAQVVQAGMIDASVRREMVRLCSRSLGRAAELIERVPTAPLQALSLYILKYANP